VFGKTSGSDAVPEQELHGLVDVAGADLDLQGVVEGAR
jgi:hypothetical protein